MTVSLRTFRQLLLRASSAQLRPSRAETSCLGNRTCSDAGLAPFVGTTVFMAPGRQWWQHSLSALFCLCVNMDFQIRLIWKSESWLKLFGCSAISKTSLWASLFHSYSLKWPCLKNLWCAPLPTYLVGWEGLSVGLCYRLSSHRDSNLTAGV